MTGVSFSGRICTPSFAVAIASVIASTLGQHLGLQQSQQGLKLYVVLRRELLGYPSERLGFFRRPSREEHLCE